MKERIVKSTAVHEAFYQEIAAVAKKYSDAHTLSSEEILAIMSNMVGKLLAFQDQRTMTPERAMKIVAANLEAGNQQAIEELRNAKPSGSA